MTPEENELDEGGAIDNTPNAWAEALRKMADEARADAAQRDSATQLSVTLDDLSRVLDTYAVRLTGVERVAESQGTESQGAESQDAEDAPEEIAAPEMQTADAPSSNRTFQPFDLPGWIRDTLDDHHNRISALEASLADALGRIAFLESNANLIHVDVPANYTPDAPADPNDYNPEAWGSIERARQALTNRVRREHARRIGIRQTVLSAVTNLAQLRDADPAAFSDDDRAQLRQQSERGERLAKTDVTLDVKIDEIAALDDLEVARAYDAEDGWPE